MRESKFRAWNGKGMIVSGQTDLKYYIEASSGRICWLERYDNDDWGMASTSAWKLMQYTGLKDKNGVEIYEGDILRICGWTNSGYNTGATEYIVEVKWDKLGLTCGKKSLYNYSTLDWASIEVIGNIYENPELLRGGDE